MATHYNPEGLSIKWYTDRLNEETWVAGPFTMSELLFEVSR